VEPFGEKRGRRPIVRTEKEESGELMGAKRVKIAHPIEHSGGEWKKNPSTCLLLG